MPFNVTFPDPDAAIAYGAHGRRRLRPLGAFFKNAHPRTTTVALQDPRTGTVRKERKPLCPVCGAPAEGVKVIVLDAGELCPDCPERAGPTRGPLDTWVEALDRRRRPGG